MHPLVFPLLLLLPAGTVSVHEGRYKGRRGPVGPVLTHAVAHFGGDIKGEVVFAQTYTQDDHADRIRIIGKLYGVPPGAHGFHIHQYGDLRDGCKSAGDHHNPSGHNHSAPAARERHEGDLGNVMAGPIRRYGYHKYDGPYVNDTWAANNPWPSLGHSRKGRRPGKRWR